MWACALGHTVTASVLYKWQPSSINVCQKDGALPLATAKLLGHDAVKATLEQLDIARRYVFICQAEILLKPQRT